MTGQRTNHEKVSRERSWTKSASTEAWKENERNEWCKDTSDTGSRWTTGMRMFFYIIVLRYQYFDIPNKIYFSIAGTIGWNRLPPLNDDRSAHRHRVAHTCNRLRLECHRVARKSFISRRKLEFVELLRMTKTKYMKHTHELPNYFNRYYSGCNI